MYGGGERRRGCSANRALVVAQAHGRALQHVGDDGELVLAEHGLDQREDPLSA